MRRLTIALTLALVACGDGTGVEYTDPDDLRLAIVGGDGQVGSVQEMGAALVAAVGPTGVLPDTLVARITDASGGHANVPPNTVVNYVVPTAGCGAPWIDDATPDDSAYVATLWEKPAGLLPDLAWHDGVWGSSCTLEARTVVDGVFKTDTMFTALFVPGAIDHNFRAPNGANGTPDLVLANPVEDTYGNPIPYVMGVVCDQADCGTVEGTMANYPTVQRAFRPVEGASGVLHLIAEADTFATGDFYTVYPDTVNHPDFWKLRLDWR